MEELLPVLLLQLPVQSALPKSKNLNPDLQERQDCPAGSGPLHAAQLALHPAVLGTAHLRPALTNVPVLQTCGMAGSSHVADCGIAALAPPQLRAFASQRPSKKLARVPISWSSPAMMPSMSILQRVTAAKSLARSAVTVLL